MIPRNTADVVTTFVIPTDKIAAGAVYTGLVVKIKFVYGDEYGFGPHPGVIPRGIIANKSILYVVFWINVEYKFVTE